MGCCGKFILNIFKFLIKLVEVGIAVAIIIIIAIHLQDVYVKGSPPAEGSSNIVDQALGQRNVDFKFNCALGNLDDQVWGSTATNYCAYAYSVAGISLAVSLAMSLLLCLTCDLCGCGLIVELVLALCLVLWWMAAAIVLSNAVADANDWSATADEVQDALSNIFSGDTVSQENWRISIPILAWCACVCFFLTLLICIFQLACGCCGGSGSSSDSKQAAKEAKQAAKEAKEAQKAAERANKASGVVEIKGEPTPGAGANTHQATPV